ncbi:MAG: HEAT repeat domain-containing protein [Armatimonadetes bacterium]|nr:HEAT repeat domain-containing protein [Armatimonadota bacterium]
MRAALAQGVPAALTALAAAGGEVESVLAVLFDAADHPARAAAAAWLGSPDWVGTPVADWLLQRVLQGRDEALLATVLGGVAAAGETALLRRVFTTGGPAARRLALQGLAELGDGELVTVGLFDDEPAIRREAAAVLARLGDVQWLPALRDGLELETDPEVRTAMEAAAALLAPAEAAPEEHTEEEEAP